MTRWSPREHYFFVEKLLSDNRKQIETLETVKNFSSQFVDREGNQIPFPVWVVLRNNDIYRNVLRLKENRLDLMTTWEGSSIFPFETKLFINMKMYAICPADNEIEARKTHDRFIFAIDQKMFSHIRPIG